MSAPSHSHNGVCTAETQEAFRKLLSPHVNGFDYFVNDGVSNSFKDLVRQDVQIQTKEMSLEVRVTDRPTNRWLPPWFGVPYGPHTTPIRDPIQFGTPIREVRSISVYTKTSVFSYINTRKCSFFFETMVGQRNHDLQ